MGLVYCNKAGDFSNSPGQSKRIWNIFMELNPWT